jgi:predicted aldo/keto reductase-like oxidoreductase
MGTSSTTSPALIRAALDNGIVLFATSAAYQEGNNEEMLGEVFKNFPRDSFFILTNSFDIQWIDTPTGILKPGFSRDELLKRAEGSLKRLGVEYVDFFTQPFAARRESVIHDQALRAMEALKQEGITRFTGIATHRYEPEAIRAAAESGIHDFVMTSYNFLKENREELGEAIQYAAEAGLGIIAMKTMAGAYYDKERTKPVNTRAALKWVVRNSNIHTTVPDCTSFEQLSQNIRVMAEPELNDEEWKDLFPPSGTHFSEIFCQQCGICLQNCPCNVDIPALMRSYMYLYGYGNRAQAKSTLAEAGMAYNPCSGCSACLANCRMGHDIRKKICDISGILGLPEG